MRQWMMRIAALLTCLAVSFSLLPLQRASAAGEVPQLRVLLRRLNLTTRADLILDGNYTLRCGEAELALPWGSQVTVALQDGRIRVYGDSMILTAGSELTLVRHAGENGENGGLRFTAGGNLYPGDLNLTISAGNLQPVLTIGLEDYLLGVVPYEMSDSFPLEALKAQAICARTYALSRVRTDRAWDVVDTTADQVFRGVSAGNRNAAQAVAETRGKVGMYQGQLATCYYSASNGGQTDRVKNVWFDRTDWAYYKITDDPYDLENPASPVKRAGLRQDAADLPEAFLAIVHKALAGEMRRKGYDTDFSSLMLTGIDGLSLGGAAHGEENDYLTELSLTVTWKARRWLTAEPEEDELSLTGSPALTPSPEVTAPPTPKPTPWLSDYQGSEATSLTLPIFPELIRALDLSIAGSDNELVSLEETDDGWVIESRRFGHGVGMSQRGAEWMAKKYGKTCEDIMAFYYPGVTIEEGGTEDKALPVLEVSFSATVPPAVTPAPKPTLIPVSTENLPEGAVIASVENVADDSSLNMREAPNTAADILTRLYKHQPLIILETLPDGIWARVRVGELEGYVMLQFVYVPE
ncbi:MAG: SpoIID/LytB domain-containing protein [Clostridia bacterium]|nr:SpoIID/LytB domain-containing protein [Clostridia bacterium]